MSTIVRLGRTNIKAEKNAFGALPIQRIPKPSAVKLLQTARAGGITFFDTAHSYTDSEEKLGAAFGGDWAGITIATKTPSTTVEGFWSNLHQSLSTLGTSCIDIYQFHNFPFCPKPGDGTGLYEAMLEAKAQGKIRFIGITNHRLPVAIEAVESGLYDTLQFPFSYLSSEKEEALVALCKEKDVGFIAMKALSGGLITSGAAAYAHLAKFENVLPIWGIQKEEELSEFLSYIDAPPALTPALLAIIEEDRVALTGDFCRGCGYCMPCTVGINISWCARMSLMLRRAPAADFLTGHWQEEMGKIEQCTRCGVCKSRCPYGLDIPRILENNLRDYKTFL